MEETKKEEQKDFLVLYELNNIKHLKINEAGEFMGHFYPASLGFLSSYDGEDYRFRLPLKDNQIEEYYKLFNEEPFMVCLGTLPDVHNNVRLILSSSDSLLFCPI